MFGVRLSGSPRRCVPGSIGQTHSSWEDSYDGRENMIWGRQLEVWLRFGTVSVKKFGGVREDILKFDEEYRDVVTGPR